MSIRTQRVASLIKEEIASLLVREFNSPSYGFITVTDVNMTPDLRIARIYFSVFGKPEVQEQTMAMLDGKKSYIRGVLGSKMKIRFVPELQFHLDGTMERVERLDRIFRKIHEGDKGAGGDSGS